MSTWILNTNPRDYAELRADTEDEPCWCSWTVAEAMKRGDYLAIYGHGSNRTFGFLGMVLSDPVKSIVDDNWWSWLDVVPGTPVSISVAKDHPEIGTWPSFRNMRWGARRMDPKHWIPLLGLLLEGSPRSAQWMSEWHELRRSELELPSLRYSYRRYDNTDGSGTVGELRLQKGIRKAWIVSRRGRNIDPEADGCRFRPA